MGQTISDIRIPERMEDLDLAWFRAALAQAFPSTRIMEARVLQVMAGTCTKIRVGLETEAGSAERPPRTVLVIPSS